MRKRIKTKRVYEKTGREDGMRILVDRKWPRGVSKEKVKIDEWFKEIAPSNSLRKWFSHKPERWSEFKKRYFKELKQNESLCNELLDKGKVNITLFYSAADIKHNNAVALKEFLMKEIL